MIWRTILLFGLILTLVTSMMSILRRQPSEAYWIAYLSGRDNPALSIMNADGSRQRVLVDSDIEIAWVTWSPDSRWIAFTGIVGTDQAYLYVIQPNRTRPTRVISVSNNAGYLTWSLDSQHIAYNSYHDDRVDIFTANVTNSEIHQVTATRFAEYDLHWSPDGNWIYFLVDDANGVSISRINLATSLIQRLTPPGLLPSFSSWSPDGKWLAFDVYALDNEAFLYRMRPDGSDLHQLTNEPTFGYPKEWSPKDDWFVFDGGDADEPVFYLIGTDGTGLHTVPAYGMYNNLPQWSPNGEWIIFETWANERNDIFRVRPDGSDLQNLTNTPTNDHTAVISPLIDLPSNGSRLLALGSTLLIFGLSKQLKNSTQKTTSNDYAIIDSNAS